MKSLFKTPLTAAQVKARALELGADLVGIADGAVMDANPPDPADPRRPSDITEHDGARVIVLARRLSDGVARIAGWGDRHKYYNDELALSMLEETALSLVYWLEDNGYPAVIVPPTHVDPWRYQDNPAEHQTPLLSLPHAAVEAGLGTLGLNLQLLTPQYGPRVILSAVLCSVPVDCDAPMAEALCRGPSCGRCLSACPGDAVKQWDRDWPACDEFRSPYGFSKLTTHIQAMMDQTDAAARKELLRSETTFNLWQSILRGAGVVTGCRRCADVCPVGEDYAVMLRDAVDAIPEDTPAKRARLAGMLETDHPDAAGAQSRWVRPLNYVKKAT